MRRPPRARPEPKRAALALAIASLHGLALILLFTSPKPPHHDAVLERVMTIVARPAAAVRAVPQPPSPSVPLDRVEVTVAPPTITIASDAAPSSITGQRSTDEDCDIERGVADTLARDPAARAAFAAIGPARAETGAVNLWNGDWVTPPDPDDAARLSALRPGVRTAVAAATRACADTEQVGPRLIPIAGQVRPTLLVIGSGRWRWHDLMLATSPHG